MLLLALLAPFAVLHSEMPPLAAWPLALVAAGRGLWLAWREARRPVRQFEIGPVPGEARLDSQPIAMAAIQWRGPLAFLHWRDAAGQGGRLAWWPDTLPMGQRRELRIAASAAPATIPTGGMAT